MPRYKLVLEYDGTPFVGWQRQTNGLAVQQVVEEALAAVDGAPVSIRGAGRTDAGVHASGQVAHADLIKVWDPYHLREAVNAQMRGHRGRRHPAGHLYDGSAAHRDPEQPALRAALRPAYALPV